MIQPEELRIGNYVNCFGTREVISIGKKKVKLQSYKDGTYYTEKAPYNSFDVAPIPLNEEWLLKLGFEYYKPLNHYRKVIEDVWLHIYVNNSYWLSFVDLNGCETKEMPRRKIISVHQLQNLFYALTYEELTLKQ